MPRPGPDPYEWAKRQCEKRGIAYQALDNGFRSCADPKALQQICDRLGPSAVTNFFWRWWQRLPSPLTEADRTAGYRYDLAFRQFEVSDTRVFNRPAAGRAFFEGVIRDHLDIGRPSSVALIFDRRVRRTTPGPFRTRVITPGVDPQLSCTYRSSRIKQYFKEHRALRTETVVGDTHDFGIGRRLCAANWRALRAVGDSANRRLCDVQAADAQPAPDVVTFTEVARPSTTSDGLHAPALRFADPRVVALLAALLGFCHVLAGFRNRELTELVRDLWHDEYSTRQATYDLRRLIRKGVIARVPRSHRYQVTPRGRRIAVLFTKTYGRVLTPALAHLDPALPSGLAHRSPLAMAWHRLDAELDAYITKQLTAA